VSSLSRELPSSFRGQISTPSASQLHQYTLHHRNFQTTTSSRAVRSTPARTIPPTDLGRDTRPVQGSRGVGGVEANHATFYTGRGCTIPTAMCQPEAGREDGITEL